MQLLVEDGFERMGGRQRREQELSAVATRRAVLLAGGLAFLFFSLPPLLGAFYFSRDLSLYDAGVFCELRRLLSLGDSLLLSPVLGNGTPLLADPQAQALYPPRWIALLLPAEWGLSLLVAFHLAVAAAAMTWLGRTFRLRPGLAVLAGLAFSLSGTVLDLIGHAAYLVGAAYLPLAWAAARSVLFRRGRRASLLFLGVALAGCLLGGEPQSFGIALGLVLLEGFFGLSRTRARAGLLRLAVVSAGASLVGLSAWWATFEEMKLSPRSAMPLKVALSWPFQPEGWLASLLPGFLTERIAPRSDFWVLLNGQLTPPPWNPTPYLGALLVVGAFCAFALRGKRSAAIVFLGALLMSLGGQTPVLPLLSKVLPPLASFRYPAKYLVTMTMAAVLLGFSAIHASRAVRTRRLLLVSGACGLGWFAAVGALAWIFRDSLGGLLEPPSPEAAGGALRRMILQGAVPLAAGVAVLLFRRDRRWLGALVVADLAVAAPSAINVGPGFYSHASPLRDLGPESIVCVAPSLGQVVVSAGDSDSTWEQLFMNRTLGIANFGGCGSVTSGISYSALTSGMNLALGKGVSRGNERPARALGCTHIVALSSTLNDRLEEAPIGRLKVQVGPERVSVRKVPSPIPSVFLVKRPVFVPEQRRVLKGISLSDDADSVVRGIDDPLNRLSDHQLPDGLGASVGSNDWPSRERARVTLNGTGGAVVGLRTAYQAGWHAEQAGIALDVARSAGTHLAVVVPDVNRGPVYLEYRLPRRGLSVASAFIGLLAIGAVMAWPMRSRSRTDRRTGSRNPANPSGAPGSC